MNAPETRTPGWWKDLWIIAIVVGSWIIAIVVGLIAAAIVAYILRFLGF